METPGHFLVLNKPSNKQISVKDLYPLDTEIITNI